MGKFFERTENEYYFGNLSQALAAANPDLDIRQIKNALVQELWKDTIHTLSPDPRNRTSLIWTLHSAFDDDILRDLHPMPCFAPLDHKKVALAISRTIQPGSNDYIKELVDQVSNESSGSEIYRKETLSLLSEIKWSSYPINCQEMIEYFIFPSKKFPDFCKFHGFKNPIKPYEPSLPSTQEPQQITSPESITSIGPVNFPDPEIVNSSIEPPALAFNVKPNVDDTLISAHKKTRGRRPIHIKTYIEKFMDRVAAAQVEERPIEEARWLREWLRKKLEAEGSIVREKDLPAEETIRNNLYAVWCFDTRQLKPKTPQTRRWLDTE